LVEKVRQHRILSEVIDDVAKLFENEKEKRKSSDLNEVLEKFHLDVPNKKRKQFKERRSMISMIVSKKKLNIMWQERCTLIWIMKRK